MIAITKIVQGVAPATQQPLEYKRVQSLKRGTAFHEVMSHLIEGKPFDGWLVTKYGLRLEFAEAILNELSSAVITAEVELVYGEVVGIIDALVIDGDKVIILDWKTGEYDDKYLAQLGGYAWLCQMNGIKVDAVKLVLVDREEIVTRTDIDNLISIFLQKLEEYRKSAGK